MTDSTGSRFRIALDLIECAMSEDADKLVDLFAEKIQPIDLDSVTPEDEPELALLFGLCIDLAQTAATLLAMELKGRDLNAYWQRKREVTSLTEMERDVLGEND